MLNKYFRNSKSLIRMNTAIDDEMALSEHIEEFSQRLLFSLLFLLFVTIICFSDVNEIVKILQVPALGVKFLQFAPGEYFFASIKIAAFSGILISIPVILFQLFLYLIPGLTKTERNFVLPISLGSGILFFIGLLFSYFFLVPTIKFFYYLWFKRCRTFLVFWPVFWFYCSFNIYYRSCISSSRNSNYFRIIGYC